MTLQKKKYKNYLYFNFELQPDTKQIFDGNLDIDTFIRKLSISYLNINLQPNQTIIFLDEIQSCPAARTALKAFALDKRYDVLLFLRECFKKKEQVPDSIHEKMKEYFTWHILVGGMPAVVNSFLSTNNFSTVLNIQKRIVNSSSCLINTMLKLAIRLLKTIYLSMIRSYAYHGIW